MLQLQARSRAAACPSLHPKSVGLRRFMHPPFLLKGPAPASPIARPPGMAPAAAPASSRGQARSGASTPRVGTGAASGSARSTPRGASRASAEAPSAPAALAGAPPVQGYAWALHGDLGSEGVMQWLSWWQCTLAHELLPIREPNQGGEAAVQSRPAMLLCCAAGTQTPGRYGRRAARAQEAQRARSHSVPGRSTPSESAAKAPSSPSTPVQRLQQACSMLVPRAAATAPGKQMSATNPSYCVRELPPEGSQEAWHT